MAQSALTVTPPSPTPPTNFACTGATGPNPPNFTKNTYNDPKNWSSVNPKDFPPPYFDDGTAQVGTAFVANTAALASGSGATAGGSEGTYPGAGSPPFNPNMGGAVPASSSVAHEGAGTESVATASVPNPSPAGQLQTVGCLGNYVGVATVAGANNSATGQHASSLSPATNPALASISPTTAVSGASGTDTVTCTGTNFNRQSVVYVTHGNTGIFLRCATTYVSATSLTAVVPKRTAAGTSTIEVQTGGVVVTGTPRTLTYT